jgi:hypothetical protein
MCLLHENKYSKKSDEFPTPIGRACASPEMAKFGSRHRMSGTFRNAATRRKMSLHDGESRLR